MLIKQYYCSDVYFGQVNLVYDKNTTLGYNIQDEESTDNKNIKQRITGNWQEARSNKPKRFKYI